MGPGGIYKSAVQVLRTLLVSIAMVLACSFVAHGAEPAPAASLTGLAERLRALTTDTTRSYQHLLRDASHEVRQVAVDQRWEDIEPELQKQGLQLVHAVDLQHTSRHRYLVTAEGWRAGDQSAHALFLEFNIDRRSPTKVVQAKPGFVMTAEAGLAVQPNHPYAQALTQGGYPESSVIARGLRLPEVAAAAQRHPILAKIEVTYDFIRDHNADSWPQGFSLHLTFTDAPHDDRQGERLHFTVASGLDAPQDAEGARLQQPFAPQDTLGDFRRWGGSEWRR